MYRRLPAQKDTYIQDRFINSSRREEGNVGRAGTIDLFKLSGFQVSGSTDLIELSRALIQFDLNPLRALTGSRLNLDHPSFQAELHLHDVYAGQTTPNNFSLVLTPLSQSWNEGRGFDVVSYNDIDSSNFLTRSLDQGVFSLWHTPGANAGGLLGSDDIDIILSGDLGSGVTDLSVTQSFELGTEDLRMDVTQIVSATIAGILPDVGWRIAFVPGEEADDRTRFVKRFASRQSGDPLLVPRLIIRYDDSIQDNQVDSFFDIENTVFLYNYDRDGLTNLTSGSAGTAITGSDSLVMRLFTDSPAVSPPSGGIYNLVVTASQYELNSIPQDGVYSASFTIRSTDPELTDRLALSSSIEFTQIWGSLDGTVGYLTSSNYRISKQDRRRADRTQRDFFVVINNMRHVYTTGDIVRARLFAQEREDRNPRPSKIPFKRESTIFHRSYYRVRDAYSDRVVVPFETGSNATRLSTDGDGMYFDLYMGDLESGRHYEIDILTQDGDTDQVYRNVAVKFRVEP
jgi:hypothetical protein